MARLADSERKGRKFAVRGKREGREFVVERCSMEVGRIGGHFGGGGSGGRSWLMEGRRERSEWDLYWRGSLVKDFGEERRNVHARGIERWGRENGRGGQRVKIRSHCESGICDLEMSFCFLTEMIWQCLSVKIYVVTVGWF